MGNFLIYYIQWKQFHAVFQFIRNMYYSPFYVLTYLLATKKLSKLQTLFLCFSARRNFKKLLSDNSIHPALDASHGSRFMFMLFIIMGHRITTYGGHPIFNAETEERVGFSILTFRRRIKSRLPFAGIIMRLPYSTRFSGQGLNWDCLGNLKKYKEI